MKKYMYLLALTACVALNADGDDDTYYQDDSEMVVEEASVQDDEE